MSLIYITNKNHVIFELYNIISCVIFSCHLHKLMTCFFINIFLYYQDLPNY